MLIRESAEQRPDLIQTVHKRLLVLCRGDWYCVYLYLTCDGREEDGDEAEEDVAAGHGWSLGSYVYRCVICELKTAKNSSVPGDLSICMAGMRKV